MVMANKNFNDSFDMQQVFADHYMMASGIANSISKSRSQDISEDYQSEASLALWKSIKTGDKAYGISSRYYAVRVRGSLIDKQRREYGVKSYEENTVPDQLVESLVYSGNGTQDDEMEIKVNFHEINSFIDAFENCWNNQRTQILLDCLNELKNKVHASVIKDYYFNNLSVSDIALKNNVSPSAITKYRKKALESIKRILSQKLALDIEQISEHIGLESGLKSIVLN